MKRAVWLMLAVAVNAIIATVSQAQTNSWIDSSDGKWEKKHDWDNGSPSDAQSAVIISNATSKVVTIDTHTARNFPDSLTISNLTLSAQGGVNNTLFLDNTGTVALHILNGLAIGIDPDDPAGAGGMELISTNSMLVVDGLLGGQLEDDGTMVIAGGSLITTNCSLLIGSFSFFDHSVGLLLISNAIVQARDITITTGDHSMGTIEMLGGTMTLSSFLSVGNGINDAPASLLVANRALLVVTNAETGIGGDYESGGTMTVSDATFFAAGVVLGGIRSGGTLAINNGTVTLSGELIVGIGDAGSGEVTLNGGTLVVTNDITIVAFEQDGGILTISDGVFLGQAVLVGTGPFSGGILSIEGGVSILSSNLQVGAPGALSDGRIFIAGGQLFVTNAPIVINGTDIEGMSQCVVSGGQLLARTIELEGFAGGELVVDDGSATVSEGITLGDCNETFDFGYASVDGGQLIVTNAAHTGFIDVRDGELALEGGTLQVDKLVMTNTCGSFVHTGGTLIVGSVILDPNAFRIVSVTPQGNDMLVTWMMGPGATNTLQAVCGGTGGSCTMSGFADIFIVTNNTTAGTLTNYLDIGAATNTPSRYYRARLMQ